MIPTVEDKICCPVFDPAPWDDTLFEWNNKRFVKEKVRTFFYMPLNYGSVMKYFTRMLEFNTAKTPENICLSYHRSLWTLELYMSVNKKIVGANNVKMSGKFYSRVYEGAYNESGKWSRDMEEQAQLKGLQIEKKFHWYTTCPKCAKKYGKNYVVIIAKIA